MVANIKYSDLKYKSIITEKVLLRSARVRNMFQNLSHKNKVEFRRKTKQILK